MKNKNFSEVMTGIILAAAVIRTVVLAFVACGYDRTPTSAQIAEAIVWGFIVMVLALGKIERGIVMSRSLRLREESKRIAREKERRYAREKVRNSTTTTDHLF